MQRFKHVLLGVLLCLGLGQVAQAQVNAVLGGTVSDATGAVMNGVTVTARNVNTGIVSTNQSNDTGNYNFPSLQPGQYTVTATMSGFQTATYTNLSLGQGENVRQNFTLQIASATTSIEVVEEAPTISSTTTASVGAVLSERAVATLPILNRNVLDLAATSPGVVTLRNALLTQRAAMHAIRTGELPSTSAHFSARDAAVQVGGDAESPSEYHETFSGFDWLHAADGRQVIQYIFEQITLFQNFEQRLNAIARYK